jgi:hypothetical protein
MYSYTVRNIGLRVLADEGQRKMILVRPYEEGDHGGFDHFRKSLPYSIISNGFIYINPVLVSRR